MNFDSTEPESTHISTQTRPSTANLVILALRVCPPALTRGARSTLTASAAAKNKLATSALSRDSPRAAHSWRSFRVVSASRLMVAVGGGVLLLALASDVGGG